MNILSFFHHLFYAQKPVRALLNSNFAEKRTSLAIHTRVASAVRPLFIILGPTTIDNPLLSNMLTILHAATPSHAIPLISDSINTLPSSLGNYSFDFYRIQKHEPLYAMTAQKILTEVKRYKPDIIYCDIQYTTPLLEYLLRSLGPQTVIATGPSLPSNLTTIRLLDRTLLLSESFPFLIHLHH